ncbi:MAG TPA: AAA family ATPase [Bradyrhizobium sp.]|nr:AAA family ATPase [Bradyrhizobium sp.]
MKSSRVHITGASGSGTTTLGRALADLLGASHHDTDDYFWLPTDPPYRERRNREDRLRLMREMFLGKASWVLSGSLIGWGDSIIPYFDAVVFLSVSTELRLERLRQREARRFGVEAIAPGGWRYDETRNFLEWASHYEEGPRASRNRAEHEAWLAALGCSVLCLDGVEPTNVLIERISRLLHV